jgi:S-adenosyl-L-methionine hydrolase (adenosine-forming)
LVVVAHTSAVIALVTDFGLTDPYAGILKGVISRINPDATVVDLTHGIPPGDVRAGAFALLAAWRYFPAGSIFVAVVDPGVGTSRRALVAKGASATFVGPDNGVLSWALADQTRETVEIRALSRSEYWLPTISSTFHGRDIFAPVAAHLSRGIAPADLGDLVGDFTRLPTPRPERQDDGSLRGHILVVDHFGNLITDVRPVDLAGLGAPATFSVAGRTVTELRHTYADEAPHHPSTENATHHPEMAPPRLIALVGSAGFLEIAHPNGSAAALLGARPGDPIIVRARRSDDGS